MGRCARIVYAGRWGCAGLGCGFVGVSFSFCGVAWRWVGGGGRQKSGTFLEIGADGFFDHTAYEFFDHTGFVGANLGFDRAAWHGVGGGGCYRGGFDLEIGLDPKNTFHRR